MAVAPGSPDSRTGRSRGAIEVAGAVVGALATVRPERPSGRWRPGHRRGGDPGRRTPRLRGARGPACHRGDGSSRRDAIVRGRAAGSPAAPPKTTRTEGTHGPLLRVVREDIDGWLQPPV